MSIPVFIQGTTVIQMRDSGIEDFNKKAEWQTQTQFVFILDKGNIL